MNSTPPDDYGKRELTESQARLEAQISEKLTLIAKLVIVNKRDKQTTPPTRQ